MLSLRHNTLILNWLSAAWLLLVLFFAPVTSWSRPTPASKKNSKPLTIFIAGDVMLGRGVAPFLRNGAKGTNLALWRLHIKNADIAFCNLECAFSSTTKSSLSHLIADPLSASSLGEAGFDVVSTANNHALDGGSAGVLRTREALKAHGITALGSRWNDARNLEWPAYHTTIRGRRVAFLAASVWGPFLSGQARVRPPSGSRLVEQVERLSPRALVFVSLHWGIENLTKPTVAQRQLAHHLIDAGAAAIIGHHPHVVQEVETYRGRPIFYSLGNFLFDRMSRPQGGLAAVLSIDDADHVHVSAFNVQPVPRVLNNNSQKSSSLQAIARWLIPRNERAMKVIGARLLPGTHSSQLLVWSRAPNGHRLRAYEKTARRWRLVAQGRHAEIFDMQCGNVKRRNKGGNVQIVLGLRQRSKLDVTIRNRLHVYELNLRGGFRPVWRGSALSRPFRAYALLPDTGGNCDLVAVEKNPLPDYREFDWITIYRWNDFGFRALWDTPVRGTVANLRIERDGSESGSLRHVIQFEQKQKNVIRTLTLRSANDRGNAPAFKAFAEP